MAMLVAGTHAACKVWLRDAHVSSFHCSLVRTPTGLWVVDLASRGGIALNGSNIRAARIDEGDDLVVGSTTIRVRYGKPCEAPVAAEQALAGADRADEIHFAAAVENNVPAEWNEQLLRLPSPQATAFSLPMPSP